MRAVDIVTLDTWPWDKSYIGHRHHIAEGRRFAEAILQRSPNGEHRRVEECACEIPDGQGVLL